MEGDSKKGGQKFNKKLCREGCFSLCSIIPFYLWMPITKTLDAFFDIIGIDIPVFHIYSPHETVPRHFPINNASIIIFYIDGVFFSVSNNFGAPIIFITP